MMAFHLCQAIIEISVDVLLIEAFKNFIKENKLKIVICKRPVILCALLGYMLSEILFNFGSGNICLLATREAISV